MDALASHEHLIDHLAGIWRALPERGSFYVPSRWLVHYAEKHGVDATFGEAHHTGPPVLVANRHDLTQCHRLRPAVFVEHGAGQTYSTFQNHPSYSGGSQREQVALFLTLNETTAARERARYPKARVEVVGSPRLDALSSVPRRSADQSFPPVERKPTVAFAWHWPCPLVPETKETFTYWKPAVRELHNSGRWEVLGHGHPRWFPELRVHYEKIGIEPVADFADVVARADVLAFDNSSVGYEAAALGIPVVALNHPRYRRDVSHGLRFWDSIPGPQADDASELGPALAEALCRTVWKSRAQHITDQVYPPATRVRAAQLAADAITDWLGSRH